MNANRPTSEDLIEAVCEFLEKRLIPKLDSYTAFHTRVAVNALGIVGREIKLSPGLDAGEHERLLRLLRQDGNRNELNALLCRRIRDGLIDYTDPALIEHMKRTTVGHLSIDNPDYSTYRQWLENGLKP